MARLVFATVAVPVPMGAQRYEREIASRAPTALGDGWTVEDLTTRSMRSPLEARRRLPFAALSKASPTVRGLAGRVAYPRHDVLHRTHLELPPSPVADVVTLHDVVAWTLPDESASVRAAATELRRAAAVICVSQFTADLAGELFGIDRAVVVPNGVDRRFFAAAPLAPSRLAALGVQPPFVLTTGGSSQRKNLAGLAEAWPRVRAARPDLTLVLAGPEHPRRTSLFRGLSGVRLLGMVPDDLIPALMGAADAVVVPSTHEGFGLPALEAMAVGTPVVAADRSALPEVVGDAGILVAPTPHELAEGIVYAVSGAPELSDLRRRGRARAQEFTWERSAEAHAAVWTSIGGS